jgi:hypothetical protein
MKSSTSITQQLTFRGTIMGLDMYAFAVNADSVGEGVVDVALGDGAEQISYWRKFNALHGWMEDLYRQKRGLRHDFNCTTVRLDLKDLDRLEMDVGANKLVPRNGFFFGQTDEIYPEDLESVAVFVKTAREAIADGKAVFYDSWW